MKISQKETFQILGVFVLALYSFNSYLIDSSYGDLATKCYLQIGEHDFNEDNVAEIIIAFGKRGDYLECKIFQYHEPAKIEDAYRIENWTLIGDFDEYGYHNTRYISMVEKNKITFPFGSQGASEGFVFVDSKFVQFQGYIETVNDSKRIVFDGSNNEAFEESLMRILESTPEEEREDLKEAIGMLLIFGTASIDDNQELKWKRLREQLDGMNRHEALKYIEHKAENDYE